MSKDVVSKITRRTYKKKKFRLMPKPHKGDTLFLYYHKCYIGFISLKSPITRMCHKCENGPLCNCAPTTWYYTVQIKDDKRRMLKDIGSLAFVYDIIWNLDYVSVKTPKEYLTMRKVMVEKHSLYRKKVLN